MAKPRSKQSANAPVSFGLGRSAASAGKYPTRIGTKGDAHKRGTVLGFRVTESEMHAIREAHAKNGAGQSFAEFAASVMMDGLASREGGLAIAIAEKPASSSDLAALRALIEKQAQDAVRERADAGEKLQALARHQKGLAERLDRVGSGVGAQTQGLMGMSEQMDALSTQAELLTRAIDELGARRAPPAGSRPPKDQYSQKLL